jgi:RNA recognition motif-containing protein
LIGEASVKGEIMNNKLFVGNLAYSITDSTLTNLFASYGEVVSCKIATDRDTGRPRGFGFVEMETQAAAEAAIKGLDGHEVEGRAISVNVSQPKASRPSGGDRRY